MRKIPNSHRLDGHISRALNKIRKPSTPEEITELLNRDLEPEDRPFQTKEVTEWLQNTGDTALRHSIGQGLVPGGSPCGASWARQSKLLLWSNRKRVKAIAFG